MNNLLSSLRILIKGLLIIIFLLASAYAGYLYYARFGA